MSGASSACQEAIPINRGLPDDIWPLIWEYLPPKDLLFASHVCRTWRIDSLAASRLWTRLTLNAYDLDADPDRPDAASTVSNIRLLHHLLPRSKLLPLSLDVDVAGLSPSDEFYDAFGELLRLVAPRLVSLRMFTADPTFAGKVFCEYDSDYPMLRVLDLSSSVSEEASWFSSTWEVGFVGDRLPQLVSFALHRDHRLHCVSTWANLHGLTCTVNTLLDIEPLLLTANRLQRLRCECFPSNVFEPDDEPQLMWPNAPLLAALSVIPDVHITALFEPANVELAFLFFASPPRPQLLLDFVYKDYYGPLKLHPCAQLSTTTHLSIEATNHSIIVTPTDDSGRVMRIALRGVRPGMLEPTIDWEFLRSFPALTQLSVDAVLWQEIGLSFPRAPLLARTVLRLRRIGDVDTLLSAALLCTIPPGMALELTSDVPIADGQIEGLKKALGVSCISLVSGVRGPGDLAECTDALCSRYLPVRW